MANLHRGEITAEFDGTTYRLCLSLGALAELESRFDVPDILALVARITTGKLSASQCIAIIAAGLRAGGHDVSDAQVARMSTPDGVPGFIAIVARLLAATFGAADTSSTGPIADGHTPGPFHGAP
jgi:hypothetical protein